jgi:hypothetical protein
MSASETAVMSSIMLATNCSPAQAEAALAALIETGWQAPPERFEAPPPGAAVGVFSPGSLLTAQTDGACSGATPAPAGGLWSTVKLASSCQSIPVG